MKSRSPRAFIHSRFAPNRGMSDSRILSRTVRRLTPHQFHYETGAPLLYWFGTQPILAHRSHVYPLAKLLILSLFPER